MGNKYNDSEMESVKKSWAGERAKLAQMTGKEKADYIFTYYKIHILLILGILIAVGWLIHHAMTYVDYEFFGMVINGESVNQDREQEITEYLGMTGHEAADLSAGLTTDEDLAFLVGRGSLTLHLLMRKV